MTTAKIFQNGRSQAVRLPKAFRFDGLSEVRIERDGDRLILSPPRRPSIERMISALSDFSAFPDRVQAPEAGAREAL